MACRYGLLAGAAFCNGFVVGPLVDMALGMHPAMVLTAFLATASIFACFSGAGEFMCMLINVQTYCNPIADPFVSNGIADPFVSATGLSMTAWSVL